MNVQNTSYLSPFMQELIIRQFKFKSHTQNDSHIRNKLNLLTRNNLIQDEKFQRHVYKKNDDLKLIKKDENAAYITDQTQRLTNLQARTQSKSRSPYMNADPNNMFWTLLGLQPTKEQKLKIQMIDNKFQEDSLEQNYEDDLLVKVQIQSRSKISASVEDRRCIIERTRQSINKEQISKLDKVLQQEILKKFTKVQIDQPQYLSRNLKLRSQCESRRPAKLQNAPTSFDIKRTEPEGQTFCNLKINSRNSQIVPQIQQRQELNTSNNQYDQDPYYKRIKDYITDNCQTQNDNSFWVNKKKQITYTRRLKSQAQNRSNFDVTTTEDQGFQNIIKRNNKQFTLLGGSPNEWTNNI